jgi:hypothetical protein
MLELAFGQYQKPGAYSNAWIHEAFGKGVKL